MNTNAQIMAWILDTYVSMQAPQQRQANFHVVTGKPIRSGGSVGRGGGTVEEQFATWPPGAVHVVKQTLQGEMVERTLATPEILRSQVLKIAANQAVPPVHREPGPVSRRLAAVERATYVEIVESAPFQSLVEKATPYTRLGSLNIGSRPASRPSGPPGLPRRPTPVACKASIEGEAVPVVSSS